MSVVIDHTTICSWTSGSPSYYSAFPVIPTWRDPGLCCGLVLVC
jgi:hypothetical protein